MLPKLGSRKERKEVKLRSKTSAALPKLKRKSPSDVKTIGVDSAGYLNPVPTVKERVKSVRSYRAPMSDDEVTHIPSTFIRINPKAKEEAKKKSDRIKELNKKNDGRMRTPMLIGIQANYSSYKEIYEHNQAWFLERLPEIDSKELTDLESWWCCIVEPVPAGKEDRRKWAEREMEKIERGRSGDCRSELVEYLEPLDEDVFDIVRSNHRRYNVNYYLK